MQGAPRSESRCQNLLFAGRVLRPTQQLLIHDGSTITQQLVVCCAALELPPFASARSKGEKIGMIAVCPQNRNIRDDRLRKFGVSNTARPFSKHQYVLISRGTFWR